MDERSKPSQEPPVAEHIPPQMPALSFDADIPIALDPPEMQEDRVLDEPLPVRPLKITLPAFVKNEAQLFVPLDYKERVRLALPARPKQLSWRPDGSALACVLYGHAPLCILADETMQEVLITNAARSISSCWSPSGKILAISAQGEISFWDIEAQSALPLLLRFNMRTIEGLDWSRNEQLAVWVDDQILLYTLPEAVLNGMQVPSPQAISTGAMRCGNVGVLRWSPDGSLLALGAHDGAVVCWSMTYQADIWQVVAPGQKVNALAWSPDGTLLAAAFRDNRSAGWHAHTRQRVFLWEKLPAMPRALSISAEGRIVLASSEKRLLLGLPHEAFPTTMLPGQLLASWSPAHLELATLDAQRENLLLHWQE